MDYPNFDGECHSISESEDFGYIASKINPGSDLESLQTEIEKKLYKYAEYLVNFDKEKAASLLTDIFRSQVMCGCTPDDYQIIHRPPWIASALAQYGTLILKFKRAQEDTLDAS